MRILIAGGSGYLGTELARQAAADGHEVIATYRSAATALTEVRWWQLDVRRRDDVRALIDATSPDVVLNVAYQYDDWDTTATGAGYVAAAAEHAGAHLVHVSSDALFSGAAASYPETARPDPVMPYGAAKAAAETAVEAVHPAATIARTSLITGDGRSPHEQLVHDLAAGRRAGALFSDDIRCPVHVADLASALLELAALGRAGAHHVAGPDAVSRHELGCLIARRDGLDPAALPTATRAGQVAGPLAVRLDCRATQALLRTRLRGAREFLAPADADSSNPGVGTAR